MNWPLALDLSRNICAITASKLRNVLMEYLVPGDHYDEIIDDKDLFYFFSNGAIYAKTAAYFKAAEKRVWR